MDALPPPSVPVAPYVAPAPKVGAGLSSLGVYGLDGLKSEARQGDEGKLRAIKKSSKQVEALFLQQAMKQFRATGGAFKSDLFQSSAGDTYTQMLDGEMSQVLSERGLGLAEGFEENLKLQSGIKPKAIPVPSRNMPAMKGGVQAPMPSTQRPAAYSTNKLDSVINHISHGDKLRQSTPSIDNSPSGENQGPAAGSGDSGQELESLVAELSAVGDANVDLISADLEADPLALPAEEQVELDFYSPLNEVITTRLLVN